MHKRIDIKIRIRCFSGVSVVVVILMILGTGYDYYLTRKLARNRNIIYDLEKHGKLDHLTNGERKVINGKTVNVQKFFGHLLIYHNLSLETEYQYIKIM